MSSTTTRVQAPSCPHCAAGNREGARFCRDCGGGIPSGPLGPLVGLEVIKQFLANERATAEGARRQGVKYACDPAIVLMGNQGTGKTTLGREIARELESIGLVKSATPVLFDANVAETGNGDAINAKFVEAAGAVLFIDNGHCLLGKDGAPTLAFRKLSSLIENDRSNTVVILAGSAAEIDFSIRTESDSWSKFSDSKRFVLRDFTLDELVAIAVAQIERAGFRVEAAAREKLGDRFRYLQQTAGSQPLARANAYRAIEEGKSILREHYKSAQPGNLICEGDIVGKTAKRPVVEEVMGSLDALIGMDGVKDELRRMLQEAASVPDDSSKAAMLNHYILTGNPGTGKTTVARLIGDVLAAMNLLPTGHVVEVTRSDLVGQYQGHTAPKVAAAVARAMGGVLFLDEAYALYSGPSDNFGKEAVDALVKLMEDNRGRFVLIAAGYPREMQDFMTSNSGLQSRFRQLSIGDYNSRELLAIVGLFAKMDGYSFSPEAEAALGKQLDEMVLRKGRDFGNARDARNRWDEIRREKRTRPGGAQSGVIEAGDLPDPASKKRQVLAQAMSRLELLVGLDSIKSRITQLRAGIEGQIRRGRVDLAAPHFLFLGNAGTGKTEVARLLGDVLFGIGALPTNNVLEVKREDLVATFGGQTAPKVNDVCRKALGGVLFIDEAYTLSKDSLGSEATDALLTFMEENRGKLSVVAAGYRDKMNAWLDTNQGLQGRFTEHIGFQDYSDEECHLIFKAMCERDGMSAGASVEEAVKRYISNARGNDAHFGNARTVRGLYQEAVNACSARVLRMTGLEEEEERRLLHVLEGEDIKPWTKLA